MNILYMTISYSFDKDGLYQNLVDCMINKGHKVTIVRSYLDSGATVFENIHSNLNILSVKTLNLFCRNIIKKGIAQVTLPIFFKKAITKYLKKDNYDLVIYATPPVTLSSVVKFCKKKFYAKTFLMLKDIFPQNAVDLGMIKKNSLVYKYFRKKEVDYYNNSDYIGCMSEGNKKYLLENNKYIPTDKVHIFPNSITISSEGYTEFNEDKTVFMFGGNLGKPQNIPFLLKIIAELKYYEKAEFVIVGKGTEVGFIKKYMEVNKLKNLKFYDFLPQAEYEKLLCKADVGIISLDPRFTIPNIPSRFQVYLKLKKPTLAITDTATDLRNMIEDNDCGWWCSAFDESAIIEKIKYICSNKELQKIKGEKGFQYLVKQFNVEDNVRFISTLLR